MVFFGMTSIIFQKTLHLHLRLKMYKVRGNIWIEGKTGALMGSGRMNLLEQIDQSGSITAAAKTMKMSYRQAWELVDSMNKQSKKPLVVTSAGGIGGGGSIVTLEGKKAIKKYKELLASFDKFKSSQTVRLKL